MVEWLKWHGMVVRWGVSDFIKLFGEDLFVDHSVREVVFGYHDKMLKMGTELYPTKFYTDFVGILAGVS